MFWKDRWSLKAEGRRGGPGPAAPLFPHPTCSSPGESGFAAPSGLCPFSLAPTSRLSPGAPRGTCAGRDLRASPWPQPTVLPGASVASTVVKLGPLWPSCRGARSVPADHCSGPRSSSCLPRDPVPLSLCTSLAWTPPPPRAQAEGPRSPPAALSCTSQVPVRLGHLLPSVPSVPPTPTHTRPHVILISSGTGVLTVLATPPSPPLSSVPVCLRETSCQ